jgi:tRNA-splicing ligase RtcB
MKTTVIFGEHDDDTIKQLRTAMNSPEVVGGALCADGHLGYSLPIGGVVAYDGAVSPSGVGYDIACGNMSARLDVKPRIVKNHIDEIMDTLYSEISFGVGRKNKDTVEHELFDDPAWDIEALAPLKQLAQDQLGTVGSGNHFVDLFEDENGNTWVGVHFGSRGLGHRIATYYVKAGGGKDGVDVAPVVFPVNSYLGEEYVAAMNLAGHYAYAGREWVVNKVAWLLGARIEESVHNHHNFAWNEVHHGKNVWVVRKGATPAFPGQRGFIGGSMGDVSAIVHGIDSPISQDAFYSTVHGAGRVMSRTRAAGKRKRINGQWVRVTEGEVSREMMLEWVTNQGVTLRGAGTDESPHVYRRLPEVLAAHEGTIEVEHWLRPLGVAMAGENEHDPYKD